MTRFNGAEFYICSAAEITKNIIESNNNYSSETMAKFVLAYKTLLSAAIMVRRMDYLVEDDDSEDTFHERWKYQMCVVENDVRNLKIKG